MRQLLVLATRMQPDLMFNRLGFLISIACGYLIRIAWLRIMSGKNPKQQSQIYRNGGCEFRFAQHIRPMSTR